MQNVIELDTEKWYKSKRKWIYISYCACLNSYFEKGISVG